MPTFVRPHRPLLVLVALATIQALGSPRAAAQTPAFEWSTSAETPVVTFRELLGELEDPDPGPAFVLYGDGRLLVHFPPYMKRAGDWATQLSADEMRALVSDLLASGAADFDPDALRAKMRAAGPRMKTITDPAVLEAGLDLVRYRGQALSARIRWTGARRDALQYPEIPELQKLLEMRRALVSMLSHDGLERVR